MTNTTLTDTTSQLPDVGTDIGTMLENLAPGVTSFIFILAIVGAILGILGAVVFVIKKAINRNS